MDVTQQNQPIAVSSPLGEDVLLFRRMMASDQLGRLFEFDLELLSVDHQIKAEDVLGESLTVRLDLPGGGQRFFNGLASQFSCVGDYGRYASYHARISPWLWFLTRTADCRIFQNQTVPDIIKQVFRDFGFTDFEDKLTESYRTWEYCVQYRETAFNFVSRLMEQEGIFYYFRHADGNHMLVLVDSNYSLEAASGYEEIPYYRPTDAGLRERDHISTWSFTHAVQPGKFVYRDFDFEKPKANLEVQLAKPCNHTLADLEVFDYPGEYLVAADGDTCARLQLEGMHTEYEQAEGGGDVAGLGAGRLFKLVNYPRDDQNREYVVVATTLDLALAAYESEEQAAGESICTCGLTVIPSSQPYRSPLLTPKPLVQGPQTAIIVGKAGEEIWTDKYGRVKVQFHWDRYGQSDENSSCWVRVSTPWAGKGWGGVAIPRIGQEVIVDFIEGDPDRPIITGRVYNADNMPPFGLPAGAVTSGLKSNSTKGGGGYNEYAMDDTKGNELIREHGQFDKDSTVEHDLREHILNDRFRDVTRDENILIGQDRSEEVKRDQSLIVGRDKSEKVLNNKEINIMGGHTENIARTMEINVGNSLSETVAINYAETVGAAMELTVGGALAISVGAVMTEAVGGNKTETIGISKNETIGGSKTMTIGAQLSENIDEGKTVKVGKDLKETIGGQHSETTEKEYLLQAKKIQLKADDELSIKVGKGEIVIKKNGDILIKGNKINAKSSGDIILKGSKIKEN